jgi:cell fate (sporulation/competence/biofilm development) regulator YlbF (YheA/YmcA/DUF963 family)
MTEPFEVAIDVDSERSWPDIKRTAKDFAAAFCETPQYEAFERAYVSVRDDDRAQEALAAFEEQQRAVQPLVMLGVATDEQRAELECRRATWMSQPAVQTYLEAETAMSALCAEVAELLSERIGLSFAAACRSGCCGEEDNVKAPSMMSSSLRAAADALAESLEESPAISAYREAVARQEADHVAQKMLAKVAEAEREVRVRQREGTVDRDDIDRVRAVQQAAMANPVIARYVSTRRQALDQLPRVNGLISELIGWDFASMTGPGRC